MNSLPQILSNEKMRAAQQLRAAARSYARALAAEIDDPKWDELVALTEQKLRQAARAFVDAEQQEEKRGGR
jgi:hypothetical protein